MLTYNTEGVTGSNLLLIIENAIWKENIQFCTSDAEVNWSYWQMSQTEVNLIIEFTFTRINRNLFIYPYSNVIPLCAISELLFPI